MSRSKDPVAYDLVPTHWLQRTKSTLKRSSNVNNAFVCIKEVLRKTSWIEIDNIWHIKGEIGNKTKRVNWKGMAKKLERYKV